MVGCLIFMICCWILSVIHINMFLGNDVMQQKTVSLRDSSKMWFRLWERLLGRRWRIYHFCQHVGSKRTRQIWCKNVLVSWIVFSILGSQFIFFYMNTLAVERRKETLASMCDERARMLQDQFNVSMNHIQALSILVSTFYHSKNPPAIDQATFEQYTERTAFERPLTSGVAYALRVLHSERERFEKEQGWTIKRMDIKKQQDVREDDFSAKFEASPVQEEYAPVVFAQDTVKHVISIDMLSGEEDRDNVLRARASGKGVLSPPFRLLKSNCLGVILTFAIYKSALPPNASPNERVQATKGYLGGIFHIESLVEKLLQQLASKQTIIVHVYDKTNASAPISMYGLNESDNGIFHISSLSFGDPFRKHEMRCRFKHKPPMPWLEISSSFGVLVIALLIGYIFYATMNRIAKVEDDYFKMRVLKKRAEAADIAKSQFLATVSHEIRTPMNGVLGMLQMLMDTELDITQQDYVRTAQASGKALVSLINEVLDQAKIESGKLELEAVNFNLRAVMDDVLSLFSGKAHDKQIELAVFVSNQVPEILIGDPGRFRQIITNLVGNSIKFTEKGHIFVTIHLLEEVMNSIEVESNASPSNTLSGFPIVDKRRSWENFKVFNRDGPLLQLAPLSNSSQFNLIVSVEDTGSGIPQEAQSRVFTPFMQVGPSISRIHGGTGIGLSISKCLVGLMNGEIGFASEIQKGSTFTFTATFANGHTDSNDFKSQHQQNIKCQSGALSSEFRGMTALVVDHRPVRAKATTYHLQRLGIQVEVGSDLNRALSQINSTSEVSIHMILVEEEAWFMDTNLSSALAKELEKDDRRNSPKLFLLSNSVSSLNMGAARSLGYIPVTKPLRASMLAVAFQGGLGVGNKANGRSGRPPLVSSLNLLLGKHILVVDDNVVNQKVAAGALRKYGAQVTCADSGKKAIALLKPPHKFDACFMDIQMPEMDGFEATRTIRRMEIAFNKVIQLGEISTDQCRNITEWHVPILAMTADVIQATYECCSKSGMDGYVSKPFEAEQLYREVTRFFESAPSEPK